MVNLESCEKSGGNIVFVGVMYWDYFGSVGIVGC